MTGPADFLARWSRRKRAAATRPAAPPADSVAAADTAPPAEEAPVVDLSALPGIDEITAGSDVSAFLQRGVPADLTRAALRRAWASDPAIRDYVGLADYDWDFHTPGALAGFGPLRPGDDVAQMVEDVFREIASDNQSQDQPMAQASEAESAPVRADVDAPGEPALPEDSAEDGDQTLASGPEMPAKRRHGRALPS
ncbi:MAG: DUF3306 domain-containing protein [Alphaproteobacteria bacterium]